MTDDALYLLEVRNKVCRAGIRTRNLWIVKKGLLIYLQKKSYLIPKVSLGSDFIHFNQSNAEALDLPESGDATINLQDVYEHCGEYSGVGIKLKSYMPCPYHSGEVLASLYFADRVSWVVAGHRHPPYC